MAGVVAVGNPPSPPNSNTSPATLQEQPEVAEGKESLVTKQLKKALRMLTKKNKVGPSPEEAAILAQAAQAQARAKEAKAAEEPKAKGGAISKMLGLQKKIAAFLKQS